MALEWLPSSHGSGAEAPLGQKEPGSHARHTSSPVAFWYEPGGQGSHRPAPALRATVLAAQGRHTAELFIPGMGFAVPGGHAMHDDESEAPSSGLYMPARQDSNVSRTSAAPAIGQKPPRGHPSHEACPVSPAYVAGGQGVHSDALVVGLCAPRGHSKHEEANSPGTWAYEPGEQSTQAAPCAAWCLPVGQEVHFDALRNRSLPRAQAPHSPELSSAVCSSHS